MIYVLSLIFIAIEVLTDCYQFTKYNKVNHNIGWIIRAVAVVLICILYTPLDVLIYAALFTALFSFVMGYLITGNPFHIGTTSKWDIKSLKLLKVPMAVYSSRIMAAAIFLGSYYFPEEWVNLYVEILYWLSL